MTHHRSVVPEVRGKHRSTPTLGQRRTTYTHLHYASEDRVPSTFRPCSELRGWWVVDDLLHLLSPGSPTPSTMSSINPYSPRHFPRGFGSVTPYSPVVVHYQAVNRDREILLLTSVDCGPSPSKDYQVVNSVTKRFYY